MLAGETAEGSGVPSELMDKLPKMTYSAAKISHESRKALIKESDARANTIIDTTNVRNIQTGNSKSDTIEVKIPGLQVGDGDEQESEDTHGQPAEDQNCEQSCEICQSEYDATDEVMLLPCNHFYHQLCIGMYFGLSLPAVANPKFFANASNPRWHSPPTIPSQQL